MEDRRRNKRLQLSSKLIMKRIDGSEIGETAISVTDVSKTGVGFDCGEILTIGAVYESFLTIWTSEVLHAFLEIVRIEKTENTYSYGAIFVGMPEMDANRIEVYDTVSRMNSQKSDK